MSPQLKHRLLLPLSQSSNATLNPINPSPQKINPTKKTSQRLLKRNKYNSRPHPRRNHKPNRIPKLWLNNLSKKKPNFKIKLTFQITKNWTNF